MVGGRIHGQGRQTDSQAWMELIPIEVPAKPLTACPMSHTSPAPPQKQKPPAAKAFNPTTTRTVRLSFRSPCCILPFWLRFCRPKMLDLSDFVAERGGNVNKIKESQRKRFAPEEDVDGVVTLYEEARAGIVMPNAA